MNDSLHISEAGLSIEKEFEKGPPDISPNGFATRMYRCDAGKPTIGYGHVIRSAGDYMMTACIDEITADKLLAQDNRDAENAIKRLVQVPLAQNEFDALVSLVFNIGAGKADGVPGDFADSTLLKKLNAGDRYGAAAEFPRWDKFHNPKTDRLEVAGGLHARRLLEQALFLGDQHV